MKDSTKKTLKTIIPLGIGVFLIWLSLSKFSKEDFEDIKQSFLNANYFWVVLSIGIGLLSHLSRAYRWKFILEPMGYKTKMYNNAMAVFVAYLVNMGIPRAGEISRAAIINQYEDVPFEKAFGTIIAERIADMVMYLLIIMLAFFAQYELIKNIILEKIPSNPIFIICLTVIVGIGLYIFYRALKRSSHHVILKIKSFIKGLWEGILSIYKMDKKWAYLFHTIFIWLAYVLMLYVVTFAFDETTNIGISAVLVCFVMGTFSFATTNGGIGVYPLVLQKTLLLYGITETIGASFGWIMWTAQILLILVLGSLSFIFLPILNKK